MRNAVMKRSEYKDFEQRYADAANEMKHLYSGACPGCSECGIPEDAEEYNVEPFFSWRACHLCGSSLGGDRHPAHYRDRDDDHIAHIDVCTDCYYYTEYGQLDDTTMMDMEED